MCKQQFQLHGRKEPSWTSVTACPKVHVGPINSSEILLVALGGMLAQSVVSQSVKGIRFRCHIRVEQYLSGRNTEMRPGWDFDTGREGQRCERDTVEGY